MALRGTAAPKPVVQARGTAPAKPALKARASAPAKPVVQARQTYTAPKPAAQGGYSGPAAAGSDSGGGGGIGGGGIGGGGGEIGAGGVFDSAAMMAAPAPAMQSIDIPDPNADPVLQTQIAELARNMADFDAQQGLAKSQYEGQYNQGVRRLGWNQQEGADTGFGVASARGKTGKGGGWSREIPGAYGDAYNSNEGDFAGRGMFNSGSYAKSVSNLNDDFTDRKNTMDTAKTDWQNTQGLNRQNLEGSQNATRTSALSDAVARIAAQYGVNLSDVTPGRTNQIQRAV